ncbi:competence protein CoiA family protein [Lentilactobacillus senioris]|uniref:competence protein CoiA n=1 Tax=Lentilactobacillus senioris TaxID=931534 RepID=UPI00228154A0|nr:competence protein CoiA family protein [Lentilactobacillus senioris]MCY9807591.1 competence protein CoiA family protein [Lentilactobacillus senioris]
MAKRNDKLVLASEVKNTQDFICPGCLQLVLLRRGSVKIAHFAHLKSGCNMFAENESQLHLGGKKSLLQMAQNWDPAAQLETTFDEVKQRADIYLPTVKLALEYQCSPINQDRLQQRTQGYSQMGVQVVWILGNPYLSQRLTTQTLTKFARFDVNLGFYLVFWDAKRTRFVLWADIIEVAGQYEYHESQYVSYQELKQFLQQCSFYQRRVTLKEKLKQLTTINNQIQMKNKTLVFMVTQCYQVGRILPACPLICHPSEAQFPIFGCQTLFWRILVTIKMFERDSQGILKTELNQIYTETIQEYGLTFYQIINFKRFYRLAFLQYLQELTAAGYLKQTYDKVIIIKRPEWFEDWEQKRANWSN